MEKTRSRNPKFTKPTLKSEWFPLLTIAIIVGLAIWSYPLLPDLVPSHWNVAGEIDDYQSRLFHILMFPGIAVGLYLLFLALPWLEPRKLHFIKSWGFYSIIKNFMMGFFLMMFGITTWAGLSDGPVPIGTVIPLAIGLLFIVIGNYMPQIKSNFLMGIRTPWTLSSDTVWRKTHLLGGYVFVIAGIAFIIGTLLPAPWNLYILLTVTLFTVAILVIYSYVLYLQENK